MRLGIGPLAVHILTSNAMLRVYLAWRDRGMLGVVISPDRLGFSGTGRIHRAGWLYILRRASK